MLDVRAIDDSDFNAWQALAEGYEAFYGHTRRSRDYARLWSRLHSASGLYGLGAYLDGRLNGFAHYLFHPSCWEVDVCYLQDLFVAPEQRHHGLGAAMMEQVIERAKLHGASRVYWHTQANNRAARLLYDRIGSHSGFIRYERNLG